MHGFRLVVAFIAFAINWVAITAQHDHGHDHGDSAHEWEWSAIFPFTSAGHYVWTAERGESGSYADASMKMLILPANGETAASLDAAAHEAEEVWNSTASANWVATASGSELRPGIMHRLDFDGHSWLSVYEIHIHSAGPYAFFCEHFPIEFENNMHFLKTESGEDVEPLVTSPADEEEVVDNPSRWGEVFAGSFLTVLPTLVGIMLIIPFLEKFFLDGLPAAVNSFASGVLFSAAVFLLLPEAHHLTGADTEEVTQAWTWGTAILAGWIVCVCMHHFAAVAFKAPPDANVVAVGTVTEGSVNKPDDTPVRPSWSTMIAISGPVLFGDFMHNFCDGIVVGIAFKSCNVSFAWTLVGATVAHEVPQELADFVVLVRRAGIKWYFALFFNFISGISTVIGALIFYDVDVSQMFEGWCLAFGAGVYLYVAVTELGPDVAKIAQESGKPDSDRQELLMGSLKRLLGFTIGAVSIGLVLLGHEHCSGDDLLAGAEDPHAGHNHGGGGEEDAHAGHNH